MKMLVPDELWALIEPLLPKHRCTRRGGRPRIDDRKVLTGIMFILKTGIPWEDLPQELGAGSGMTCWHRLQEWNRAGVWRKLHLLLLNKLEQAGRLNWDRAVIDSSSVHVMHRGEKTGKNPTDRAKYGTKRHVLTDANGIVLNVEITSANRHDLNHAKEVSSKRPRVRARRSRRYRKPKKLLGDRGCDSDPFRQWLDNQGIDPLIARRAAKVQPPVHGSGLGVWRWVVEHVSSLLNKFRRLRIRDDVKDQVYESFLSLGVIEINFAHL